MRGIVLTCAVFGAAGCMELSPFVFPMETLYETQEGQVVLVDNTHIYFQSGHQPATISRGSKDGSSEPELVFQSAMQLRKMVMDDTHLYVAVVTEGSQRGQIIRSPKAGGTEEVLYEGEGICGVAVDAAGVVWEGKNGADFDLLKRDAGSSVNQTISTGATVGCALALTAQDVIYTNPSGALLRAMRTTANPSSNQAVLIPGGDPSSSFVTPPIQIVGDQVFYGKLGAQDSGEGSSIDVYDLATSQNTSAVGMITRPSSMHIDDEHIYWTEAQLEEGDSAAGDGRVLRLQRRANPDPWQEISIGTDPSSMAGDGAHVYWIERSAGYVVRFPKN